MDRRELEFELPDDLIAQHPARERRDSRLLVVDRASGRLSDQCFADLPGHLHSDDVLVLNNTRVVPARFFLRRSTAGRVEGLWLREETQGTWEVLLRSNRTLGIGEVLRFEASPQYRAEILSRGTRGMHRMRVRPSAPASDVLGDVGRAPLPPYIKRPGRLANDEDNDRYQTVYARAAGAIAAPTAGLHFDARLLDTIKAGGTEVLEVTLHVGLGTFTPLEVADLADHTMHAEFMSVPPAVADALRRALAEQRRIVAVGTTSARVLETLAQRQQTTGDTDLFIYPPYEFRAVGALVTNFHLPGSTLLALVYALGGIDLMRRAYDHAIAHRYRFYSYGDAMLIK